MLAVMASAASVRVEGNLPAKLKGALEGLLDALLPAHCLLCGLPSGRSRLCPTCSGDLPRPARACERCALPLARSRERACCDRCLLRPPPWNRAVSATLYGFPADILVQRFKFHRDLGCGALLAQELLSALESRRPPLPDAIVPVPLHRSRLLSRTFNQADVLARSLGKALGLPVQSRLLQRRRRTRAQSGLDASARARNVRGAFSLRRRTARGPLPRHVALVDDVLTTGVTLSECCRTLRRAGARELSVWVAARALDP